MKSTIDFLNTHKVAIVETWITSDEVQHILNRKSLATIDKNKKIFCNLFECFISVMKWGLTISECPNKVEFLSLMQSHLITNNELFTIIVKINSAIQYHLYQNFSLSFSISEEIEKVSLNVANELSNEYEQQLNTNTNTKNEHSNLLNEYKRAVDISSIVTKTNPKGIITYANDKFCEISGYTKAELIGKPQSIVRHPSMPASTFKNLWETIKAKQTWQGIVTNMRKDGRKYVVDSTIIPILDIDGDIVEYISIRHDVTEFEQTKEQLSNINMAMKNKVNELYNMTASLEEQATIDALTGIFNRHKFEECFKIATESANIVEEPLSLVMFDIDHFKMINDNYGHQIGDEVLREITTIISRNIKGQDILARWGGEEFVILLPKTKIETAKDFCEKLRTQIEISSFSTIGGVVTSSFGVSEYILGESKKSFLKRVDQALYMAKNNGRNRVESL